MALLSKSAILAADDLGHQDIEVQEWGGSVRVKMMSAADRDKFTQGIIGKKVENVRTWLLSLTLVDEKGALLFTQDDVADLEKKSGKVVDRLFMAAHKLNGLGEADVEETAKN